MFEITRLEERENILGEFEVFCQIQIFDGPKLIHYAHWLTQNELVLYKTDKNKINEIMEKYLEIAKNRK